MHIAEMHPLQSKSDPGALHAEAHAPDRGLRSPRADKRRTRGRSSPVHAPSRARAGKGTSPTCQTRLLPYTIQGPHPTMILPQVHLR